MIRRFVVLLFALSPILIGTAADPQARNAKPSYVPVAVCEISFHHEKANPKYISVDAEYVSAVPHGLYLTDGCCPRKALQIDFADTGLDASVALIRNHLWKIHRANGTFLGALRSCLDRSRLCLWLDSVLNFRSNDYLPELDRGEPIRLPEPPLPKWPPTL
jgi:hypothetical protein